MERRFAADEWESMTDLERVNRCALLAQEAKELADTTPSPTMRRHFLNLAAQWLRLAGGIMKEGEDWVLH